MAHATTASASSQTHSAVDTRLKELKQKFLPEYPLRLTQANENTDTRRHQGTCKYCYQNKDTCFCYAHHTFLSREEMTTYPDRATSLDNALPSKSTSSKQGAAPASLLGATPASRTGKKLTLSEYKNKKRMQDGAPGTGHSSTPKDAPSPAEATISKDQSAKSKPTQSNTHTLSDSLGGHPDNDRPTKKLKTSNNADSPALNVSSKNTHPRSPSKRPPTNDEPAPNPEKKTSKTQALKREAANPRHKSPPVTSKDNVKHRRSPSPPDRPRGRPPKKEERESRKPERHAAKDNPRPPVLPKMLSPLPEEINRLVDEWEQERRKDTDWNSMDDEPPKHSKKGLEKSLSHASSKSSKLDSDSRPSKADRRVDRLEPSERDTETRSRSPRIGFKVPAKRPPADMVLPKPKRHVVRLQYGVHNVDRVTDILESDVDQGRGSKYVREDSYLTDQTSERGTARDRSPHLPTRVSINNLKSAPGVKNAINGKIATPTRRLASSSERPRSTEREPKPRQSVESPEGPESGGSGDYDMLKKEAARFLDLGIKLKHKADGALGVKTSSEEQNLRNASIYACHSVIAYFLSFGLEDEARRRDNRSSTSEGWRGVLAYIEFLLNSRLRANTELHALLYQMGGVCSERVSAYEQQRFMSISLADPTRLTDGNRKEFLDSIKRSRNGLIQILQKNQDWWKLGHQRLPWSKIEADYRKTWSKRSPRVPGSKSLVPSHYLTPYYLPLYSGSSAFEAASFAWMVTQEWAYKADFSLDTGLALTWPKKDSRNA
ncbi:hypothetical protein TWF106_002012 [Orbilia oligospora]|uniref:Ell binding protein Ebp1 C-terminal domain-containing protein n=1 Tax=Orbilia oligospora TaxID=2813651 RepID=A0A6G1LRC0_ORBOL|nr:hypothetical protein TWF191_003514 [Orbilia oligospora]KAF3203328.1 hypothetical protein TWF106_002012 [Orbilia oligospora]KAF3231795.1 hypothetical protein TWF192_003384 [Orbilia oligospora]